MIQDIYPHSFNIAYKDAQPDENSRIMFFCEGKLLVGHTESTGNEKCEIIFPAFKEVDDEEYNLEYLFELDNVMYFRCKTTDFMMEAKLNQKLISGSKYKYYWENRHFFRGTKPKEITLAAITAMHLDGWYNSNIFCGKCANKLIHSKKERMLQCPGCKNMVYPRINPAVIVAVTNGDKILLTKYRGREYKNYALVAGFNEIGESFEETVRREVMEEAGLKVKNIRYYKSQPWGFSDNILAGYYCELDGESEIVMDDEELSEAGWVSRDEIPDFMEELSLTHEMIYQFKIDNVK